MFALLCICLMAQVIKASDLTAPENFIVGGEIAEKKDWGWQMALHYKGSFKCGATLLGARWAVTAAHCVQGDVSDYTVIAGSKKINGDNYSEKRTLAKATMHPFFYNSRLMGYPNDLAFISWDEVIRESSDQIKYIKAKGLSDIHEKNCHITGWGKEKPLIPLKSIRLRQAKVEVVNYLDCRKKLTPILPTHVCVEGVKKKVEEEEDEEEEIIEDGEVAACKGDWGGPLVCQTTFGQWKLTGVASWGTPICNTSYPSIYTRVSFYKQWLTRQVELIDLKTPREDSEEKYELFEI